MELQLGLMVVEPCYSKEVEQMESLLMVRLSYLPVVEWGPEPVADRGWFQTEVD